MSNTTTQETWAARSFPSGTQIVTRDDPNEPHFYVYGPKPVGPKDDEGDDPQAIRNRYRMCDDLRAWMNGGERPAWLDDMRRVSETRVIGDDGSSISAVGPSYDADPPKLDWHERDDPASQDKRARLIDRLECKA